MGVVGLGGQGRGGRTPVGLLFSAVRPLQEILDPGTFQGGSKVARGLVRGETVIRGVNPPRKLKLCWGRGRSPQPLPSPAGWGVGRAPRPRGHVSSTQIGWPRSRVRVPPPPLATRARLPYVFGGRAGGQGGHVAQA